MAEAIDPVLLKAVKGILQRRSGTMGAGLNIDPSTARTLGINQPQFMGGANFARPGAQVIPKSSLPSDGGPPAWARPGYKPNINPYEPQDNPNTEPLNQPVRPPLKRPPPQNVQNPNVTTQEILKFLKQEGIPHTMRKSDQFGTDYVSFGAPGNAFNPNRPMLNLPGSDGPVPIPYPKIRVPDPKEPHVGNPRVGERYNLIDATPSQYIPKGHSNDALQNEDRERYGDSFDAIKRAIWWHSGTKLVPPGSEPSALLTDKFRYVKEPPAVDPNLGQKSMMSTMLGLKNNYADPSNDPQKQRLPSIVGGNNPNNGLTSRALADRFNLITPKEFGDYGNKGYDPLTDPSYNRLLELLGKMPSTGNDQ